MRYIKKIAAIVSLLSLAAFLGAAIASENKSDDLTAVELLGKKLFFDNNLSNPPGQACVACHAPEVGWTGPDSFINLNGGVYPGAVPTRFGNRKPPASAYAGDSPILYKNACNFIGGMFWDGRATGWILGDPLAEQAQGPFLNPLEQNNPNAAAVVAKVADSKKYQKLWAEAFPGIPLDLSNVNQAYEYIARAIAAYERSKEVSSFSSKYDYYLKNPAKYPLSPRELKGLALFEVKAMCANCHISRTGADGKPPLFTDFSYENLGVPKNPMNPFYTEPEWNPAGFDWIDPGLGGFLASIGDSCADANYGKHKVPTLRNVDKRPNKLSVKAYGHNGYFKSLEQIVRFYNTRDIPGLWPPPEVSQNLNTTEVGNLGLTPEEEADIVAFLKTLSDNNKHNDH